MGQGCVNVCDWGMVTFEKGSLLALLSPEAVP